MGKKKQKGNKLAKMSDEEKMRYLQARADIEEEARRRKQQLIALYMKVGGSHLISSFAFEANTYFFLHSYRTN